MSKIYPAKEHAIKTFTKLVDLLPDNEKAKPQVFLLAGEVTPFRNDTDREMAFRQESNFYYLTGCTVPAAYLLFTAQSGTSLATTPSIQLFLPEVSHDDLMWSVPPPTLAEARTLFPTATHHAHTTEITAALHETLKAYPDALVHVLPLPTSEKPLFPVIGAEYLQLVGGKVTAAYLLPALHHARITKSPFEIEMIRKANEVSSRAHETVMRVLGQGVQNAIKQPKGTKRPLLPGEWLIEKEAEAEAIFVASCRREGAVHQAYLPIIAGAERASTLHYCCNDKAFAWGPVGRHDHKNDRALTSNGENAHETEHGPKEFVPQVLLIDAGCEWNCYASDITRTMPVGNGGKFTPEARAIYELVLKMQELSLAALRPSLHWDAIQLLCHRTLVRGFQQLGIFLTPESPGSGSWNAEEAIIASGVSSAFFPHGVGHSIGMDVHDVPSASRPPDEANASISRHADLGNEGFYKWLRLRLPLEEGMVVTVEPGIYFSPHLLASVRDSRHIDHAVLARYEAVGGVRIEDVVLITKDGSENLTTVRSDVGWLEGVCSGQL